MSANGDTRSHQRTVERVRSSRSPAQGSALLVRKDKSTCRRDRSRGSNRSRLFVLEDHCLLSNQSEDTYTVPPSSPASNRENHPPIARPHNKDRTNGKEAS